MMGGIDAGQARTHVQHVKMFHRHRPLQICCFDEHTHRPKLQITQFGLFLDSLLDASGCAKSAV